MRQEAICTGMGASLSLKFRFFYKDVVTESFRIYRLTLLILINENYKDM